MQNESQIFIDWITASQHHEAGGLPIITGGLNVHYNASGLPVVERNCSARLSGSYETSIRVGCDGFRVSLSGNVGRFDRKDNLFNFGWEGTKAACNRILASLGLPAFSDSEISPFNGEVIRRGAVVSRLDITANYAAGTESQARSVIRWLAASSISRMKRGNAGDESVWWSNTRHMLKAYIKHLEMFHHGADKDDSVASWCKDRGVVRVEIELKKRLLSDLGLNDWADISDEALIELYNEQTSIFKRVDRSDEVDLLDSIPPRSRVYASAWLAGQDLRSLCSERTLRTHAKVLLDFGLDIRQSRNIQQFPVKVRVVELTPLEAPDWYWQYSRGIESVK